MQKNNPQTVKTQPKGVIMLLLTAFIWGTSFVAQSVGMENVEAFTFNGLRTLLGAAVLIPFILVRDRVATRGFGEEQKQEKRALDKKAVAYGAILGIVFCGASNFQQFAFYYSTSGKIAFITAMYLFFVPVLGLFLKRKVPALTWSCVAFGILGLFLLCINPEDMTAVNKGDVLAAVCAFLYAIHILLVEKFSPQTDGLKLSCTQFVVSGVISVILMFIFETPRIDAVKSAAVPILYAGVFSCGIAYTFQIIGQKYTNATVASLLMCMESVFCVLAAAVILHETLTPRELLGCGIMFAAILVSQLSESRNNRG